MPKKSVSLSGEQTFTFVFLYSIIMAPMVSLVETVGEKYLLYLSSVYGVKCFEEVYNSSVALRSFAQTPSNIQQIVKICDVVDQFLWKPFWFFLRIFSILDSSSRALYILATMEVRVIRTL